MSRSTRAVLVALTLFLSLGLGACRKSTPDTGTTGDGGTTDTGKALAEGQCRDDADCLEGGFTCFSEDDDWCGACQDAEIECEKAGDCDVGAVCAPHILQCPCDQDTSWLCEPACTADSCAEGSACNTDSGLCEVVHCTESGSCPAYHNCNAEVAGTGCVRDSCAVDSECGDGWCVRSQCQAAPGFCSEGPA